ncbi:MAG: hypothetical protein KDA90_00720 [Planctomycetaceae bacterium]|nr:hypothetical protein [Planctomycetaceae bacterium]
MKSSDLMAVMGIIAFLYVGLNYCHDSAVSEMEAELQAAVRSSARMASPQRLEPHELLLQSESLNASDLLVYAESFETDGSDYIAIKPRQN